ncbi:hypothetical protein SLE2022_317850 [Rubroshorea leprosula]
MPLNLQSIHREKNSIHCNHNSTTHGYQLEKGPTRWAVSKSQSQTGTAPARVSAHRLHFGPLWLGVVWGYSFGIYVNVNPLLKRDTSTHTPRAPTSR